MAKVDIRDAYRLVPVHPEDRPFWESSGMIVFLWTVNSHLVWHPL